jgi:hypothetical protein
MNCYPCATQGRTTASVALCKHCNAALCMTHVEAANDYRTHQPGLVSCDHTTWTPAAKAG